MRGGLRGVVVGGLSVVLAAMSGCGGKEAGKRTMPGLMIVVETDLAVPHDIDRIRIQVTQRDRVLLDEDHEIGPGQLLLPVVFSVRSPGNTMPVVVRGLAFKGGEARIERSAVTPIPSSYLGRLRLPLNYLCDGTATPLGLSTCGDSRTCKQGTCASVMVPPYEVPVVDDPDGGARIAPDAMVPGGSAAAVSLPGSACFDVLACLAGASLATVEDITCTTPLPAGVEPDRINVAIRLAPGSSGICDTNACWVVLDYGAEGWTVEGTRIRLPESVCLPRSDGRRLGVAISTACGTKTAASPPCGAWSSATTPIESPPPPPRVSVVCEGPMMQDCGNCGTQTRQCREGEWQSWGLCANEGPCSPTSSQSCGSGGTQLCAGNCRWGTCVGQTCVGPAAQSCGRCGTQTRTCDNGSWSAWSACAGEGPCAPDSAEGCDGDGLRSCGGSCQWGACASAKCVGASAMACGICGTRTRTCDAESGVWSDWSACTGEGTCQPDAVMPCGSGGTRVCGGNCQWAASCSGQRCSGPAVGVCGRCGVQSRTCDSTTGTWSDWSSCMNEGSCEPGAVQACGAGGARTCSNTCQWNSCIEPCATNNGGCDPRTTCTNAGSVRICGECPSGFLGTGATGCVDVDECASANGGCDPLTSCTNLEGGRSCGACPAGYSGTGVTGCVPPAGTGGGSGSGGRGGTGGSPGTGGRAGTGGMGTGGAGSGGGPGTGGTAGTGGRGGDTGSGGVAGAGGAAGGGATAATGGAVGTGGAISTGGAPGSGGAAGAGSGCPGTAGPAMVRLPDGYCIDTTEVTRDQYNTWLLTNPPPSAEPRCAGNASYSPGSSPAACAGPPGAPVVCIDWCDAFTYCQAAGKRLCGRVGGGANGYTDYANTALSQWYNACSSHGANVYPYSGAYAATACNGSDNAVGASVAVGSLAGCQSNVAGYAGVFDLSGNVFEWEDSCADASATASCRFRGGAYGSSSAILRCEAVSQATRSSQSQLIGFRCCAD